MPDNRHSKITLIIKCVSPIRRQSLKLSLHRCQCSLQYSVQSYVLNYVVMFVMFLKGLFTCPGQSEGQDSGLPHILRCEDSPKELGLGESIIVLQCTSTSQSAASSLFLNLHFCNWQGTPPNCLVCSQVGFTNCGPIEPYIKAYLKTSA